MNENIVLEIEEVSVFFVIKNHYAGKVLMLDSIPIKP